MTRRCADPFRQARACDCGDHGFVGLTRGLVAFRDAADGPIIAPYTWQSMFRDRVVYARTRQTILMHRLILATNQPHVDHRDHDGLNNRRENIQGCSAVENLRRRRPNRNSSHCFKGVSAVRRKFKAQIRTGDQWFYLGVFDTAEEAARAYDRAATDLFGPIAGTNVDLGLLPPLPA